MTARNSRIDLRLSSDLDEWLESRAGGPRRRAASIRQILERERAREGEEHLRIMFDHAWSSLPPEVRAEVREVREDWMGVYAGAARP